jgi:hypothetical protein
LLFLPRRLPLALCGHLGRVFRHCCVSGGQSPSLMDCHRPSSTPLSVPLFTLPLYTSIPAVGDSREQFSAKIWRERDVPDRIDKCKMTQ